MANQEIQELVELEVKNSQIGDKDKSGTTIRKFSKKHAEALLQFESSRKIDGHKLPKNSPYKFQNGKLNKNASK